MECSPCSAQDGRSFLYDWRACDKSNYPYFKQRYVPSTVPSGDIRHSAFGQPIITHTRDCQQKSSVGLGYTPWIRTIVPFLTQKEAQDRRNPTRRKTFPASGGAAAQESNFMWPFSPPVGAEMGEPEDPEELEGDGK